MYSFRKLCLVRPNQCCFNLDDDFKMVSSSEINNLDSNDMSSQIENARLNDKGGSLQKNSDFPVLKIIVLDSSTFEIGTEFNINQLGLITKTSNIGIVAVGSDPLNNDIVISEKEKGVGQKHLIIKFDRVFANSYAIKDLGQGSGTFLRIEKKYYLKNNNIVSFGDSHMMVHILEGKINLRFIHGEKLDSSYEFKVIDCPINFGRNTECSLKFDDSSLSRFQCFISFDQGWFVQDGDGNRSSTNGTWLFSEEFVEVFNGMVFRAAESLFKVPVI